MARRRPEGPSLLAGLELVNPQRPHPGRPAWPHAVVPAPSGASLACSPRPLDAEVAGAGRTWSVPEWLAETHATSLLVVDRGELVHEWYVDGVGPTDLLLGASMSKSVLAHLVGVAVRAGALSLDDLVTSHVPELAGSGYARCTVRHVLTMTTGVDWVEDHRDPRGPASRLLACFSDGGGAAEGAGGSRELLTRIGPRAEPGTRWEYSTADSQVLDWVRERATGSTYAQALEGLWRVLGCEHEAVVATEGPDGVALAGGGLAATARDWARTGLLQRDGAAGGARVLGRGWVEEGSRPPLPFLAPGRLPSSITTHAGFGHHWWPLDDHGRRVAADGSRGQFTYVDRDRDVVVVKTSRWPYDDWLTDRQHRDLSYLGLQAVAAAAVAARPVTVRT